MIVVAFLYASLIVPSAAAQVRGRADAAGLECMALNLYHEARGEPLNGMIAVGQTVMTRVRSGRYPKSICAVVKERTNGVCQFSWWCERRDDHAPRESGAWSVARAVAAAVIHDRSLPDLTGGAENYVRCGIWQEWMRDLLFNIRIGEHCFYSPDDGVARPLPVRDALFALVADDADDETPESLRLVVVRDGVRARSVAAAETDGPLVTVPTLVWAEAVPPGGSPSPAPGDAAPPAQGDAAPSASVLLALLAGLPLVGIVPLVVSRRTVGTQPARSTRRNA